jgi:hypothetical protein
MPFMSRLRAGLCAAGLAAALVGTAITAMPAHAAPGDPDFGFRLRIPGGGSMQFGNPPGRNGPDDYDGGRRYPDRGRDFRNDSSCLSSREVYRQLRDYGFFDIRNYRELPRRRASVDASYGRWAYNVVVNLCTGEMSQRRLHPIGPSLPRGPRGGPGGGFGLEFNFGQ